MGIGLSCEQQEAARGQQQPGRDASASSMPVRVDIVPPPPNNSKQLGVTKSLLYNGSKFRGSQKSKGNAYEVEVVLQVSKASRSHQRVLRRTEWTNPIPMPCSESIP